MGTLDTTESLEESPLKLPKTAQLRLLTGKERKVVEAIVHKAPRETWEQVAKRLKMSRRSLYSLRRDPLIQEMVITITLDLLKTNVVDVLNALVVQAKKGNVGAARTILEYADRAWSLEHQFNQKLVNIKEALFRVLDSVAPELIMKVAHELERSELDQAVIAGTEDEGRIQALPSHCSSSGADGGDGKQNAPVS